MTPASPRPWRIGNWVEPSDDYYQAHPGHLELVDADGGLVAEVYSNAVDALGNCIRTEAEANAAAIVAAVNAGSN